MSGLPEADVDPLSCDVAKVQILLQKDFWPPSEKD